jgi:hypothetical protein
LTLFWSIPASGQVSDPSDETLCRQNLGILGDAIYLYLRYHNGRMPDKLSDLYKEGLVLDLNVFTCPASGNKITDESQIDELTDYVLIPNESGAQGVLLLKEKANNHNGQGHFFFSNWEIKKMPVSSSPGQTPEISAFRRPAEKSDRPASLSQQQTRPAGTPAAPVSSGGGGYLPKKRTHPLVFVFGIGILLLFLLIAALLYRKKMSAPVESRASVKGKEGSFQKIDLKIKILEPEQDPRIENFRTAPVSIGRDPANDLILSDPTVSRRHARITVEQGQLFLFDLSQGNRTLLEDDQIERAEIFSNSIIYLGSTCLHIM